MTTNIRIPSPLMYAILYDKVVNWFMNAHPGDIAKYAILYGLNAPKLPALDFGKKVIDYRVNQCLEYYNALPAHVAPDSSSDVKKGK